MSDKNTLTGSEEDQPIHLVICSIKGAIYIKPSRAVNRQRMMGIMLDALGMMQDSNCKTITPEDCRLRVLLTVDDEQEPVTD